MRIALPAIFFNRDYLLHDDRILQAVECAVDDLWFDLELTDDRQPLVYGIVNRHIFSQLHVD